jgi:hypothetical protein
MSKQCLLIVDLERGRDALDGVIAVISCVSSFGSNEAMFKINGTAKHSDDSSCC